MALDLDKLTNGGNKNDVADRPKSQLWLNIGYWAGEGEDRRFISLPVGIAIDTLEPQEIRGRDPKWIKQRTAQNALLEMLQKHGATMEKGSDEVVRGLTVQLHRVAAPAEAPPEEDNEYMIPLNMFGNPEPEQRKSK